MVDGDARHRTVPNRPWCRARVPLRRSALRCDPSGSVGRPSPSAHTNFFSARRYLVQEEDALLVRRSLAGERGAFDLLVVRYQKPVYNAALRMLHHREDARDAAQTAFLKAYEHLGKYDHGYRFYSWLYRIVLNEAIDVLGRRKGTDSSAVEIVDEAPGPEAIASGDQSLQALEQALQRLPAEQRAVIVLRHHLQLSYEAMAETLGLPEKTVKSRLYDARQALRVLLRDERVV